MSSFYSLGSSFFYGDEIDDNLKQDQKIEEKIILQNHVSRGSRKSEVVVANTSVGKRLKPESEQEYDSDDCSLGSLGDLNEAISDVNQGFFLQAPQNKKTAHSNESRKFSLPHQVRTDNHSNALTSANRRRCKPFLKPRVRNKEEF